MARVVAVTGGTGFVALELVKQLLSTGYTVRATVRNKHGGGTADVLSALGQALPGKFSSVRVGHLIYNATLSEMNNVFNSR